MTQRGENNFTLYLHALVYLVLVQLFWAVAQAIRERSGKKIPYYVFTLLPILLGILLPIFLGLYVIKPTVAVGWGGVGVVTSNLARDYYAITVE